MVYFVVGPTGVGKTSFSNLIKEKRGLPFFDTGPILRSIYLNNNLTISFEKWIEYGEKQYGDNYAISLICDKINKFFKYDSDVIIIGNRCIEGIKFMINYFDIKKYIIIFFDASIDCLRSNYEKRENRELTNKEFNQIIQGGNKMGLSYLKRYVINSSKHYYYFKNDNKDLNYLNIFDSITKKVTKGSVL